MKQRSDAITGLILAFVGIALLMAWRTGALAALTKGNLYAGAGGSVANAATGLRHAADALGNTGPTISTRSPQGPGSAVAANGTPEDGVTSTRAPLIVSDPWGAGGFLDESARAARRAANSRPAVAQIDRSRGDFRTLPYTPIDATIRSRGQTLEYEFRPLGIDLSATSIDSSSLPASVGAAIAGNFLVP